MLTNPLPPFLNMYSSSVSFFRCKALFLDLNSFRIHFKNGSLYLTRVTALVFISLMRFQLPILVLWSFLRLLSFFLSSLRVWCCPLQIFLSNWNFPFLQAFWFFKIWHLYYLRCFSLPIFHCYQGTFCIAKFHSYILVVYSYCQYQIIQFFLIFLNSLISSMFIRWFIFSCDFVNL